MQGHVGPLSEVEEVEVWAGFNEALALVRGGIRSEVVGAE